MAISILIIGILFVLLVMLAVRTIKKNNKEYDKGCAGCPYRRECKNRNDK